MSRSDMYQGLGQGQGYLGNCGLVQQFANDYGRDINEYEKRKLAEQRAALMARRAKARARGYRPSRHS